MKPITSFALLSALSVTAAQAVVTEPVGFYDFDGIAGGNLFIPGLVETPAFAGALTASGATTLTLAASSLTPNAYDEGATYATHYVEIASGPNIGTIVDIVSNTDSVITLAADISALSLNGDEAIKVRPHITLKSLFSSAEAVLSPFSDNATFYNADGSFVTYYWGADAGGTGWSSDFATADGSDRPVTPGTGFVLGLDANKTLTILGEAKDEPTVVQLAAGVVNIIGPVNPLVGGTTPLNDTGFGDLTAFSDSITIYTAGPLDTFITYYPLGDGTISSDFATPTTDELINTTGAVVVPVAPSVSLQPGFTIIE